MRKLPGHVISLIKAANQINSHVKAVEELVYNSLDAEATSIAIRINFEDNFLQVIDNGQGILKSDFNVIGQNYMTSKFTNLACLQSTPNKYGHCGVSLANLIHISRSVKIISRHQNSDETWMKVFENGEEKEITKSHSRPSKGTTIEVKGFLFNLDIHKKNNKNMNELQNMKMFLENVSLVHNNISLSLRDDAKNDIVFKMHKNRDTYQTLTNLYGLIKTDIQELHVEKNCYKVKAFFDESDKECRKSLIFVNGKILMQPSKLHKIVNEQFKKYNPIDARGNYKDKNALKNLEIVQQTFKTPFYVLFLSCPYLDYTLSNNTKQTIVEFKNWDQPQKLLEKLVAFYYGDKNINNLAKTKTEYNHIEKTSDTKEQIRTIVNKFLEKQSKNLEINQLCNGIKSKHVKRKQNKKNVSICPNKGVRKLFNSQNQVNREITTELPTNKNKLKENNIEDRANFNVGDKKIHMIKVPSCNQDICRINRSRESGKSNKNLTKQMKPKHKPRQKILQQIAPRQNCVDKNQILKEPLSQIETNNQKNLKSIPIVPNNNEKISVSKTKNKRSQEYYRQKTVNNNICPNNLIETNTKSILKSNYDLLNVIPHSAINKFNIDNEQTDCRENIIQKEKATVPKTIIYHEQRKKLNYFPESGTQFLPATFQSHNYNKEQNSITKVVYDIERINKKHLNHFKRSHRFISKLSTENFIVPNKRSSIKKHHRAKKRTRLRANIKRLFHKTKLLTMLKNQILQCSDKSYTIEFSECKYNIKKKYGENEFLKGFDKITNRNEAFGSNFNVNKNQGIKVNTTYTVSKYYENKSVNTSTWNNNCIYYTAGNNSDDCIKNVNEQQYSTKHFVFISNSQEKITGDSIEPVDICEVVMNTQNICKNIELNMNNKQLEFFEGDINLFVPSNDVERFDAELIDYNTTTNYINVNSMLQNTTNSENILDQISYHFASVNNVILENNLATTISNHTPIIIENPENHNSKKLLQGNEICEGLKFNMKSRLEFIPKGFSPIFENCQSKTACDYKLNEDYFENELYSNFARNVYNQAEIFEPKLLENKELMTKAIDKVASKINKDNACIKFDGEALGNAKVLSQIDAKFIAAVISGNCYENEKNDYLVLFDQHAVDERIHLENNLYDYIIDNQWKSIKLDDFVLKLSKDSILYLHNHKEKFEQFGLNWKVLNDYEISINAIPEAILGKNVRQADKVIKAVKNLIIEATNDIKCQGGCMSLYPKSIMDLVFNEACRYAIKFGDNLSKEQCVDLLQMLSKCKTPFQCAHGRPVMAVITDVTANHNNYEVSFSQISKWKLQKSYK